MGSTFVWMHTRFVSFYDTCAVLFTPSETTGIGSWSENEKSSKSSAKAVQLGRFLLELSNGFLTCESFFSALSGSISLFPSPLCQVYQLYLSFAMFHTHIILSLFSPRLWQLFIAD